VIGTLFVMWPNDYIGILYTQYAINYRGLFSSCSVFSAMLNILSILLYTFIRHEDRRKLHCPY